jgi:DNA invertase Pin-like site-specific DNA recombinase
MSKTATASLSAKITTTHLDRLAYLYIRQSTPKQVERNRESQAYQYQLTQRAEQLGWRPDRIRILDGDLGLSASSSAHRDSFQELVAEVSLGHVGIIFGYEVSRLARNNCDWYHLLDLAALFSTLIADADGVYDPRLYNDRLLLGLKGTMSEAELHLLRLRLESGRLNQVYRGAYRQRLPVGLLRQPDGTVVKHPDEQVRHILELVFVQFEELGSCRQVLRYLRRQHLLLPARRYSSGQSGEIVWKLPTDAAVYEILRSPAYAGAFVYGRRQTDPTRRQPGRRGTGLVHKPREEWLHVIQGAYPSYISWEQYLIHQERLQQNSTVFAEKAQQAAGAVREGAALLQGLAVCGLCGARMQPAYKAASHRYQCEELARRLGEPMCASLHGRAVDEVVVGAFFEALQPAQLDALAAVLAGQQAEQERLARQWRERLQRARYEAQLAERQYQAVDPGNRLVAAELERRWETKLRELRTAEEEQHRFQSQPSKGVLTPNLRRQLEHICQELPQLWNSGSLAATHKKELLRCLIARVILKRTAPDLVEAKIVWISGHYTVLCARVPIIHGEQVTGYASLVQRIQELVQTGHESDSEIAAQLAAEGFHSARSAAVSPVMVQRIRLAHGWHYSLHQSRYCPEIAGYLTPKALAERVGVERTWIYRRLYRGEIEAQYLRRHPSSQIWLVENHPALIAQLRQIVSGRRSDTERQNNG